MERTANASKGTFYSVPRIPLLKHKIKSGNSSPILHVVSSLFSRFEDITEISQADLKASQILE